MIDIKDIKLNPARYKRGAELKGIAVDIDAVLRADDLRRAVISEYEGLRSRQNALSREVASSVTTDARQAAAAQSLDLKTQLKDAEDRLRRAEGELKGLLLQVPQVPDDDVPVGKDSNDNVEIRRWGTPRHFDFKPRNHADLGSSLQLFDIDAGVGMSGSRFYTLTGIGAELHYAVLRLAFEMMVKEKGFRAITVPVMVREAAMEGTGFFPAGREQAYHVSVDDLFLAGTAEVGMMSSLMNRTLAEGDLPVKLVSVSSCFRREAGTYGKDTAGLYRVHQFDKCEQVVVCKNDVSESKAWHEAMIGYSEELLQRLGLPYRVVSCCTGDIGVKNAAQADIETWMPTRARERDPKSGYGETHSASRLYDFQSRRLNLRYKDSSGKVRYCHTLNNTVIASPRILIPIIENYQNADGSVTVPTALRPYVGGIERIEAAGR